MPPRELIQRRIDTFWGYGSLEAPVWFVGMEEGLNPTSDVSELEMRFRAADGKATVDMRNDMTALTSHMKWFRPGAPIQSTWKYPIALYLYLKDKIIPEDEQERKEKIRAHQASVLGDLLLKQTSTIELMPLPSQKADESTWLYAGCGVRGLDSREEYLSTYKTERVYKLKKLVEQHKPKLVIFYSVSYLSEWSEVMGMRPELITSQMYFAQNNHSSFCIIPQGHGMSYKRLYAYADLIRDRYLTLSQTPKSKPG